MQEPKNVAFGGRSADQSNDFPEHVQCATIRIGGGEMRYRSCLSTIGLVFVTASVVVACSAGTLTGASDGGTSDSGTPPGDGGCVEPTEGTACTQGQHACASGGDVCCIGYAFVCQTSSGGGSTWRKESVGCACNTGVDSGTTRPDAGAVVCGGKPCKANEYCTTAHGGAAPPDGGSNTSYVCTPLPAACIATPTCACLSNNGGGGCSCSDSSGWPDVTCNYP